MKRLPLLAFIITTAGTAGFLCAAPPSAPQADARIAARKIDQILAAEWKQNKLKGNPAAADEVLVRRLYLDVAGRIPTYRETEEFMNSTSKNKRSELIDKLLAGEGYVQNFYNFWADILRTQTVGQAGAVTGPAYVNFVKQSLRENKPYDQFVREMVGAKGYAWEQGAIGYYLRDRGMPLDNMAATVRVFLGTRIECAQCHNHPFDKWTQKQFFEMAAFSFGVDTGDYSNESTMGVRALIRKESDDLKAKFPNQKTATPEQKAEAKLAMDELNKSQGLVRQGLSDLGRIFQYTGIGYNEKRKVTLPHDYQYPDAKPKSAVAPATMMGAPVTIQPGSEAETLEAYAKWMTSKDNPRFTNVVANRLWKKVFGVGLIEPVDELMDGTLASNPELMKHLEELMISLNYDMRAYLRVLLNTEAYQAQVSPEEVVAGVPYHFQGPALRRMSAEQMWDSFVTLINPTPDMINYKSREDNEKRLVETKTKLDALVLYGSDAVYAGLKAAGEDYRRIRDEQKKIEGEFNAARKADDKEKVKVLSKRLGELNRESERVVNARVMAPAAAQMVSLKGGTNVVAASGSGPAMMMSEGSGDTMMAGAAEKDKPAVKKGLPPEQEKQLLDEAAYFGITDPKRIKNYIDARVVNIRTWLRSAEIESPAPRGHYLRIFGQSDRETIENSNSDASVPQALAMMNSQLLPQIMDEKSSLMLSLGKVPYDGEKVEVLYMTLLSRKPTARELEVWAKASDKGLTTINDLIYSLINTQQFIFIQ